MNVIKQNLKNPKAKFGIFYPKDLINLNHLKLAIDFLHDKAKFKPEYTETFFHGVFGIEVMFENPMQVFEFGRLFSMIENSSVYSVNKNNLNILKD